MLSSILRDHFSVDEIAEIHRLDRAAGTFFERGGVVPDFLVFILPILSAMARGCSTIGRPDPGTPRARLWDSQRDDYKAALLGTGSQASHSSFAPMPASSSP